MEMPIKAKYSIYIISRMILHNDILYMQSLCTNNSTNCVLVYNKNLIGLLQLFSNPELVEQFRRQAQMVQFVASLLW